MQNSSPILRCKCLARKGAKFITNFSVLATKGAKFLANFSATKVTSLPSHSLCISLSHRAHLTHNRKRFRASYNVTTIHVAHCKIQMSRIPFLSFGVICRLNTHKIYVGFVRLTGHMSQNSLHFKYRLRALSNQASLCSWIKTMKPSKTSAHENFILPLLDSWKLSPIFNALDSFLITWWPWKQVKLDAHLDWSHFDTSDIRTAVHIHALSCD